MSTRRRESSRGRGPSTAATDSNSNPASSQKKQRGGSRARSSSRPTSARKSVSSKKKKVGTPKSSAKKKTSSARKQHRVNGTEPEEIEPPPPVESTTVNTDQPTETGPLTPDGGATSPEPTSRTLSVRRLKSLIPSDARAVDIKQLGRLISDQEPQLSPSSEPENEPEDPEDVPGPKGYLTQKGLQTLKEYKYVSGFTGATDKYVMIPLWNYCLNFVPLWMASVISSHLSIASFRGFLLSVSCPNLLTTMSLACGIACYFLFQYHSPDFLDVPPSWVFYLTSFLMFFYLILDGLDGKQARKTGSSSPLGQLFDHGCDSICCFLCGIFMSSVIQLGSHRSAAVVLFLHILPFYTSNWEEYCTGVMRFGAIGITEGQLLICFLLAITGYIGVDYWNQRIPIPAWLLENSPAFLKPSFSEPMEYKFILIFIGVLGVTYQVFSSCMSVWAYHTEHAEERKTAKIYNKAKRMFTHYLFFMAAGVAWVFSPSSFMRDHPRIILLTVGMLFGYQVSRLIISRVTKDPYPFGFLNTIFLPYLVIIINCWIGEPLPTYPIAVSYLSFVALVYAHFIVTTINQICTFLKIKCFTIPYHKN